MLCGNLNQRGFWRRMDACICMAESLCCSPETITTLLISYTAAKSLQSCPTPCDPIDSSPPGSPVPGILQARTLEWVAISFSMKVKSECEVAVMSDSATPWTAAHQAPPSMGFARQEYWSGLPLPSPTVVYFYI